MPPGRMVRASLPGSRRPSHTARSRPIVVPLCRSGYPPRAGTEVNALQSGAAEQVLLDEVVPAAAAAHLHHVDLELTDGHRQHVQFCLAAGLPGRLPELIAVDVVHVREVLPAAARAPRLGRLAS